VKALKTLSFGSDMTFNRYIVHCISKFYELLELVCVHADSVNLEGESMLHKLFLYLLTVGIDKSICVLHEQL